MSEKDRQKYEKALIRVYKLIVRMSNTDAYGEGWGKLAT